MVVNLGPHMPNMAGIEPAEDWRQHNPRCLRRDISVIASSENTRTDQTYDLITGPQDIYWFQETMQGDFVKLILGVHSGGHYTVGGDPGGVCSSKRQPPFRSQLVLIDIGPGCVSRRSRFLPSPCANRPRLLDLAEPGSRNPLAHRFWHPHDVQHATIPERDLVGFHRPGIRWWSAHDRGTTQYDRRAILLYLRLIYRNMWVYKQGRLCIINRKLYH